MFDYHSDLLVHLLHERKSGQAPVWAAMLNVEKPGPPELKGTRGIKRSSWMKARGHTHAPSLYETLVGLSFAHQSQSA